jgi:hypothetical protein
METRRQLLSGVIGLAGISAKPAAAMAKIKSGRATNFRCRTGINVFWPWGGPLIEDPKVPNPRYAPVDVVFGTLANGPWEKHVTDDVYIQCRRAGIDHFRVLCNPGPWMQAFRESDKLYWDSLFDQFDSTVEKSLRHGIGVVVAPYLTGFGRDDPVSILGIRNEQADQPPAAYYEYTAVIQEFAARYGRYDNAMVAFELFNEPPDKSQYKRDWESDVQPELYGLVREVAPTHTIVCTSADWSSISQLLKIDPSGYDKNVIWAIHPLIPAPASQQGCVKNQYRYVVALRYPPKPDQRRRAIMDMRSRVEADPELNPIEKQEIGDGLERDLTAYFDIPQDAAWLHSQFDQVTKWCSTFRIAPDSVYVGEYGMTRSNSGLPSAGIPGYQGATREDRARYMADLRLAVDARGFRSAPDHLDTQDYGLTLGRDAEIGPWDPLLLKAIASRGHFKPQRRMK